MKKKIVICAAISLILAIVLCICINVKKNSLYDQMAASRWSEEGMVAQISIMYPVSDTEKTEELYFTDLSHQIQKKLDESAYSDLSGKKDKSGISFPCAVSITGKISINSDSAGLELTAYGVEKDFFIFHPMNLLNGSYLYDDDVMDDGVILDEDAAWKLFGSSDIAGQSVMIGNVPHIVKGVIKKDEGKFAKAAGLDEPMCFLSLKSLKAYGRIYGSYDYEMIIPDPVDGSAIKLVREVLSERADDLVIVENSYRYNRDRMVDINREKGIRSMSTKGVVFPYYENIARAWEDVFALGYLIIWVIVTANLIIFAVFMIKLIRSEAFKAFKKRIRHNLIYMIKNFQRSSQNEKKE